MRLSSKLK